MSKAVIFAGGAMHDFASLCLNVQKDDYIICADSGIDNCRMAGLDADLWVGDFDSSDFEDALSKASNSGKTPQIIRLNPIKDDTDTEFALNQAAKLGYKEIAIIGGIGTRLDHSLANIFLMEKYYDMGIKVTIWDEHNIISVIKNSTETYERCGKKYISVLPLDKVKVTNSGFVYPLKNETLHRDSSRGISNEFVSETGTISAEGGLALIIQSTD